MVAVCKSCGSLDIQFNEPADDGWYRILVTLSDQVPTEDYCLDWLGSKGISEDVAEQVATSMLSSLRYDIKKCVWRRGKTEYVNIWATFRSWCLRDLRQNGHKPATPKTPRPRAKVEAITQGDDGLWDRALGVLQLQVTRPSYETWLKDTTGLGLAGKTLVVSVPNEMVGEMLEQRMYSLIRQAVESQSGSATDVAFQAQT